MSNLPRVCTQFGKADAAVANAISGQIPRSFHLVGDLYPCPCDVFALGFVAAAHWPAMRFFLFGPGVISKARSHSTTAARLYRVLRPMRT